ncbi:MAG: uroporphyrinogen decarboxylase family protein [Deferrisomatales bacterium]
MTPTETPTELTRRQAEYRAREQRVLDAVALRTPDRVPVFALFDFLPATYKGLTVREVMHDPEKMRRAWVATLAEFAPDMVENPFTMRHLGPLLGALDFRQLQWAGHGLGDDAPYQFVEGEYMKAGEYDEFLFDPTDFMLRTYWPRVFGALAPFAGLPAPREMISYYMGLLHFGAFAAPEVAGALQAMVRAGEEAARVAGHARAFAEEMKTLGFPSMVGAATQVPFDTLGDFLRGTRGLMVDLYRQPQKVLAAVEKLLPIMVRLGVAGARRTGVPRVFIPLHKGFDGFLSHEQFERFYWPGFRDLMLALIAEGLTPCPFVEGDYTSRLGFLAQVPPGKVCYHFESTDLGRAKAALREVACIRGNVPISLLSLGTPEEVRAHCKGLIDVAGAGGGFILDASTVLSGAKVENVRAMFEVTKEYGVY